jgi:futalosine hydrolase
MKILIVTATHFEILPLLEELTKKYTKETEHLYKNGEHEIRILITGVGLMHTAFSLGYEFSANRPDLAINAGLAGSFDRNINIGTVVNITAELQADLGVEERDGRYTDMFELGLIDQNQKPYINGRLYNTDINGFDFLPAVRGISVNKVHGTSGSIEKIIEKYQPDVESMEGAAFFFSCLQATVPFMEIRAISNYVEPRNKENWSIPLAIDNLNSTLIDLIDILAATESK